MSSAKRRINSTGRQRIKRDALEIRLLDTAIGEPMKAKVRLDLGNHGFPDNAKVVIEAYHRSSGMRFECGTIANCDVPELLVLTEVDRDSSPLFRLKVVGVGTDSGRILGSAERIQPRSEDDGDGKRSLFPIAYRDLQCDTWKVNIEPGDRPRLIVNKRLNGFSHKLQESALLQGLVLPAALRFVLVELCKADETGEDEDDGNWKDEWLDYCSQNLGAPDDPRLLNSEQEKAEWIDEAVRHFAEKCDFVDRISKMKEWSV